MSAEQPVRYTPKKDQYSRARGASQFLNLFCAACGGFVLLYQKDGPGALLRLYLDRYWSGAFDGVCDLTVVSAEGQVDGLARYIYGEYLRSLG